MPINAALAKISSLGSPFATYQMSAGFLAARNRPHICVVQNFILVRRVQMAKANEIRFMVTSICPADQVAEGDRLYRSHIDWMKATHHRQGPGALELCWKDFPAWKAWTGKCKTTKVGAAKVYNSLW
jgi:hypothetical protein